MNVLILGSEGQIGKPLSAYLEKKGYQVTRFDIASDKNHDLRFRNKSNQAIKNTDFIIFLAFDVGGAKYLSANENKFDFIDNNIRIMNNTFNLIKKHKKKFIFASSQMSSILNSSYGTLKRIGEFYSMSLSGLFIRLWNVYGYEYCQEKEKLHVISDFINMAMRDGKINITGDGTDERQFLYVNDCCECIEALIKRYDESLKYGGFDVSSFKWNTIYDVAKIISNNFGGCEITTTTEKTSPTTRDKEEPKPDILNIWRPKTEIDEGIKDIIRSAKINYGY